MIGGLTIILICQLIGELIATLLQLPVPGPVMGMILLFVGCLIRDQEPPENLQTAADGLLKYLALMFVPAGTGIVAYLTLIQAEWVPITVSLIGSTVITLAVTGAVLQWLGRRKRARQAKKAAQR